MNDKEKIIQEKEKIAEALRILDEILDIIRFKDEPEDTIIDQKLEEIKKILTTQAGIFSSKLNWFSTKYSTLVFFNSFALNRILYSSTLICF